MAKFGSFMGMEAFFDQCVTIGALLSLSINSGLLFRPLVLRWVAFTQKGHVVHEKGKAVTDTTQDNSQQQQLVRAAIVSPFFFCCYSLVVQSVAAMRLWILRIELYDASNRTGKSQSWLSNLTVEDDLKPSNIYTHG